MASKEENRIKANLCGLCCAGKARHGPSKSDISQEISFKGKFQADVIDRYGRRDNKRICGAIEQSVENVFEKMVVVSQKSGAAYAEDSACLSD